MRVDVRDRAEASGWGYAGAWINQGARRLGSSVMVYTGGSPPDAEARPVRTQNDSSIVCRPRSPRATTMSSRPLSVSRWPSLDRTSISPSTLAARVADTRYGAFASTVMCIAYSVSPSLTARTAGAPACVTVARGGT